MYKTYQFQQSQPWWPWWRDSIQSTSWRFLQISNDLQFLLQCHNARFIWQGWKLKPLWTYSLTTACYIVAAVVPARANFMALQHLQVSHGRVGQTVVKLSMCTTSTNMLFSTNCHFDLDTGTKFTYFNNIGLLVVGKLSKEKTPFW